MRDINFRNIRLYDRCPANFILDRPSGSDDIFFVFFATPARIYGRKGVRLEKPGACILYTPGFKQWFCGTGDELIYHWFRATGNDLTSILEHYHLPRNAVFYPQATDFIPSCLDEMRQELGQAGRFSSELMTLLAEQFFLLLSRSLQKKSDAGAPSRRMELHRHFRELRALIRKKPEEPWRLTSMAREMHLSVSRFSALYHIFFNISPIDDLINIRLEKACRLLANTTLSIKEIAGHSGFDNVYYFSRIFHRKIGCPPSLYCRREKTSNEKT